MSSLTLTEILALRDPAFGETGFTGSQGDIGFTGSQGAGFTGSQGIQGDTGFTGSQGDIGPIGFTGSQGEQGIIGFTGSKGDAGFTGSQGPTVFPDSGVAVSTGSAWDTSLPIVEVVTILIDDYEDRGNLRNIDGPNRAKAMVEGIGVFVFVEGSIELDDDETCFATTSGRWLLEAVHWNLVYALQQPESLEGRLLFGTATMDIISISSASRVLFSGIVLGVSPRDHVFATPPTGELGSTDEDTSRLSFHAWVSAFNEVTIVLANSSNSSATTNTEIRAPNKWRITAIKDT